MWWARGIEYLNIGCGILWKKTGRAKERAWGKHTVYLGICSSCCFLNRASDTVIHDFILCNIQRDSMNCYCEGCRPSVVMCSGNPSTQRLWRTRGQVGLYRETLTGSRLSITYHYNLTNILFTFLLPIQAQACLTFTKQRFTWWMFLISG